MTTSPPTSPAVSPSSVQVLRWALAAAASGAVAALIVGRIPGLWHMATASTDTEALTAGTLLVVAVLGLLAAIHLAVVWTLAVLISVVGATSATGRAGLQLLRLLSPTLARRLSVGVISASAAFLGTGGLDASTPPDASNATTAEMVAAPAPSGPNDAAARRAGDEPLTRSASSVLTTVPAERSVQDAGAAPENAAASAVQDRSARPPLAPRSTIGSSRIASSRLSPTERVIGEGPADGENSRSARPPLAWGTADDDPSPGGTLPAPTTEQPASDSEQLTVTVRPGDTLWSLTDDLLGEGPDTDARIAHHWPLLHEANRRVIGPDPDHIEPGQELTVPHPLSQKEQS